MTDRPGIAASVHRSAAMHRMSRERALAIATHPDHQIRDNRTDLAEAARTLAAWVEELQAHGCQPDRGSWLDAHTGGTT